VYNSERPHRHWHGGASAALSAQYARLSGAAAPIEYGPDELGRKVQAEGWISFQVMTCACPGRCVASAWRATINIDGLYEVYFCHHWWQK